jgi:hypothetical protein
MRGIGEFAATKIIQLGPLFPKELHLIEKIGYNS